MVLTDGMLLKQLWKFWSNWLGLDVMRCKQLKQIYFLDSDAFVFDAKTEFLNLLSSQKASLWLLNGNYGWETLKDIAQVIFAVNLKLSKRH